MFCFRGNTAVDTLAREGALRHPSSPGEEKAYLKRYSCIQDLALHMTDALHGRKKPTNEKSVMPHKHPDGLTLPRDNKDEHYFMWCRNAWVCEACFLRTSVVVRSLKPQPCFAFPRFTSSVNDMRGHVLHSCSDHDGITFAYCQKC